MSSESFGESAPPVLKSVPGWAALDAIDVTAIPREQLPALLAQVTRVEAEIRLKLAEVRVVEPPPSRILLDDEAAEVAAKTRRWLNAATKGLAFRCDLSRKAVRYREDGLRAWLARRRT